MTKDARGHYFDAIITNKDREIFELKAQIAFYKASAGAAPPHADLVAEERERIAQIFENWIAPTISLKDAAFVARHVVARTDADRRDEG